MSERKTIYIPTEKTLQLFENPDQQTSIIHRPEAVGAEISFAVDDPDLDRVIQLVTTLCPDRAFCFLNERLLQQQAQKFQKLFLPDDPRQAIAYAVKANPRARILEIFDQSGLTFADCSSLGEIEQVRAHWPKATPLYTYPSKFPYEICEALDQGVRYFTVEDETEIKKILNVARSKNIPDQDIEICIRVGFDNPDADMDLSEKFGEEAQQAIPLIGYIRDKTTAQLGLSTNTGSQNRNPASYVQAVKTLRELAQIAGGVSSLNIGGGFPVNYGPEDDFSLEEYLVTVSLALRSISSELLLGPDPKLIIEPGRALVAEAVDLVIPIRNRKRKDGQEVLLIDDGVYTCLREGIKNSKAIIFKKYDHPKTQSSPETIFYKIHGRTCDNGDKIEGLYELPADLKPHDYLIVNNPDPNVTNFNSFTPPHYVSYNLLEESRLE